jgi:adenylate kinase family enzyme
MSSTPDQKGSEPNPTTDAATAPPATTTADTTTDKPAEAKDDATPNRPLNANARAWKPMLDTPDTSGSPKAEGGAGRGNRRNQAPNAPAVPTGNPGQNSPPKTSYSNQSAQQFSGYPGMYPPPIAPLTALAAAGGVPFPGFNPMMMSPLVMAAAIAANSGRVPQSPFAAAAAAAAAAQLSQGPVMASPLMATGLPSAHVPVNVGNASLHALRTTGPTKFACVLLVGMPRVGKTTIGRGLVDQLDRDSLKWAFFSGGDYLRDTPTRPAPWDTTKDVYDALAHQIDELQARVHDPVKGLIIDKQCRGTEELYYLTALLRSKGLHLNGVVGLVADDDTRLMERLGESDNAFREKCKFHRVIQTRIREASKAAGLWHPVDALEDQDVVVRRVRSMVLGCSSQNPHKQLSASNYHEGLSTMVDSYETYAAVMGELTKLTRMSKPSQFPGFTSYTPVPSSLLNKKSAFKDYAIRRRTDGTKYVLLYDGTAMYLVPRHMRCVFHLKTEAWLGIPLNNVAKFALDGELVRLSKERGKEKFLVQDVLAWHEKGNSTTNLVSRMSWKERQERLKVNICGEHSAFYSNCDIVVAHQTFVELKNAAELFEPCDYATDGFVFQPMHKRDDPVYFWRSPENVMVDFRLGAGIATGEGTKKYHLQVFDQLQAKFSEYGNDTVIIQENRQFVVEGALVVCTLKPDEASKGDGRSWTYVRARTDISTAAFKSYVDDLLENCLIPKSTITAFLGVDPTQPRAAAATTATPAPIHPVGAAPAATTANGIPPHSGMIAPLGTAASREGFGSNAPQSRGHFGTISAADVLRLQHSGSVPLGHTTPPLATQGAATLHDLAAVVRGTIHTASTNGAATAQQPSNAHHSVTPTDDRRGANARRGSEGEPRPRSGEGGGVRPERKDRGPARRKCGDCGRIGEGEEDIGNHQFYCNACWAVFESRDDGKSAGAGASRRGPGAERGARRQQHGDDSAPKEGNRGAHTTATRRGGERPKKEAGDAKPDGTAKPEGPKPEGNRRSPAERGPRGKRPSEKSSPTEEAPKQPATPSTEASVPIAATA